MKMERDVIAIPSDDARRIDTRESASFELVEVFLQVKRVCGMQDLTSVGSSFGAGQFRFM